MQSNIQISFPIMHYANHSKTIALPGAISHPRVLVYVLTHYEMPIPNEKSPLVLQDSNVTSSSGNSFLSFSTWSRYILIMCHPLLCTPSCPASLTSEMGLINLLKLTPILYIIPAFSVNVVVSQSTFAEWCCRIYVICPEPQRRKLEY